MRKTLTTMMMLGAAGAAHAEMVTQPVAYEIDGEAYEGDCLSCSSQSI